MTTITAAEAAAHANVTVATIRTWCRRNVIAATKTAGRWVIDTASLAHRIAIGATRSRKAAPVINLDATYTYTPVGNERPITLTPTVKRRTTPHAGNIISVDRLIPLFADHFDAITDEGDRLHALTLFTSARIVIREDGELRTTYCGTVPGITVDDVLALGAQLRTQLAK